MEDNRPTLAQYFVEQACPDNKFLEEMNNVIPWLEIETWFKGHLKKERKKTGRPSYPIILMFKIHLIQQWYNLSDRETEFQIQQNPIKTRLCLYGSLPNFNEIEKVSKYEMVFER